MNEQLDDSLSVQSCLIEIDQQNETRKLQQTKRVRFAEFPVIYKNSAQCLKTEELFDTDFLIEQMHRQSCFKDSDYSLRTQVGDGRQFSWWSIFFFLFCLIFIFLIIWWTVSKLLMVEIERQVADQVASSNSRHLFSHRRA